MSGYLERTIEFTAVVGSFNGFERVQDQIDAPLRPIGEIAHMAIYGGGAMYDPTLQDFTETGPRADADTQVGAGNTTLDLLRYVGAARQHPLFLEHNEADVHTRDVTTTIFNMPKDDLEAAAEYAEILQVARYLQPVVAVAIQYVRERDHHSGALLNPTTLHLNARLSNDPNADLKAIFTNISIDDGRAIGSHNPSKKQLTVTTGQQRSLSIQRADFPPSFHHVRIWTQLLQNIVAR